MIAETKYAMIETKYMIAEIKYVEFRYLGFNANQDLECLDFLTNQDLRLLNRNINLQFLS